MTLTDVLGLTAFGILGVAGFALGVGLGNLWVGVGVAAIVLAVLVGVLALAVSDGSGLTWRVDRS